MPPSLAIRPSPQWVLRVNPTTYPSRVEPSFPVPNTPFVAPAGYVLVKRPEGMYIMAAGDCMYRIFTLATECGYPIPTTTATLGMYTSKGYTMPTFM